MRKNWMFDEKNVKAGKWNILIKYYQMELEANRKT